MTSKPEKSWFQRFLKIANNDPNISTIPRSSMKIFNSNGTFRTINPNPNPNNSGKIIEALKKRLEEKRQAKEAAKQAAKQGKIVGGTRRRKRPTPYNLRAANELFRRSPQVAANNIKLLTKSRNKRMLRQLRKLSNTTRRR